MIHRAAATFWRTYDALPTATRKLADRNFELLKTDPFHPSLHLKPVGRFWSARVGKGWRAVALRRDDTFIWFWIGPHSEYDKLIKS